MIKKLFFAALASIIFIGAGCAPTNSNEKTYTSPDGWSISYPQGWTLGAGTTLVRLKSPEENGTSAEIQIDYVLASSGASRTAESFLELDIKTMKVVRDYDEASLVAKVIALPLGEAIRRDYSSEINGEPYLNSKVNFFKGGFGQAEGTKDTFFEIKFSNPEMIQQKYLNDFETILNSLRFD